MPGPLRTVHAFSFLLLYEDRCLSEHVTAVSCSRSEREGPRKTSSTMLPRIVARAFNPRSGWGKHALVACSHTLPVCPISQRDSDRPHLCGRCLHGTRYLAVGEPHFEKQKIPQGFWMCPRVEEIPPAPVYNGRGGGGSATLWFFVILIHYSSRLNLKFSFLPLDLRLFSEFFADACMLSRSVYFVFYFSASTRTCALPDEELTVFPSIRAYSCPPALRHSFLSRFRRLQGSGHHGKDTSGNS